MILVEQIYLSTFFDFTAAQLGNMAFGIKMGKLGGILQYLLGTVSVLIFYSYFLPLTISRPLNFDEPKKYKWFLLILYFLFNISFTYKLFHSAHHLLPWLYWWGLITFSLPLFIAKFNIKNTITFSKPVYLCALLLLSVPLYIIFKPLIVDPMLIANDYADLPEITLLKNNSKVDNHNFINQHKVGGILKYDPRINTGHTPYDPKLFSIKLNNEKLVKNWITTNLYEAKYRYIYYPTEKRLYINSPIDDFEYYTLKQIFSVHPQEQNAITDLYLNSRSAANAYAKRVYSPTEWDFFQKNKIELLNQTRTGWFFYHHNYFFSPMIALKLGESTQHLTIIYGWLNTILFTQALDALGGVDYQHYYKLLFSIYPLYFILFIGSLWLIFRKIEYVAMGSFLAFSGFFSIEYELFILAPGFNPLRHFLDIAVITTFFLYLKNNQRVYLWMSYALAFLSLLASKEFGLFLIASLTATLFIQEILHKKRISSIMILQIFLAMVALTLFQCLPGQNPGFHYMLLGIGSPAISSGLIRSLLLLNATLYVITILFYKRADKNFLLLLLTLFYCQFLIFYLLWFPQWHHFLSLAIPFTYLILMLTYFTIKQFNWQSIERNILSTANLFLFVLLSISTGKFMLERAQYNAIFTSHQLFTWSFPTAQLKSTIDPLLLQHAVQLIQRYNPENQVFLLSKYETLLPALANKYLAFPYNELITNLITTNDVNHMVNLIAQKKPAYLFVDRDIHRNYNHEIFHPNDVISQIINFNLTVKDRIKTIAVLKDVFDRVRNDYQPLAHSELITVYERKPIT